MSEITQAERVLMVGCETEEGLLIVHPEHETCDVCRNISNSNGSTDA